MLDDFDKKLVGEFLSNAYAAWVTCADDAGISATEADDIVTAFCDAENRALENATTVAEFLNIHYDMWVAFAAEHGMDGSDADDVLVELEDN